MRTLLSDLRLAVRLFKRTPGFTVSVIVVIALGVGANAAIFTAIDQTIVRPLPYADPDRLVRIWEDFSAFGAPKQRVSPATFRDWKTRSRAFADLAAYGGAVRNLAGDGPPEEVLGAHVTANFFDLLGAKPLLGRGFTAAEERSDSRTVVLSYSLWQARYRGRRDIVGSTIRMDGEPHDVVGIMPAGFDYPSRSTRFWEPFALAPDVLASRNSHFLNVVARLAPHVEVAQAQDDMLRVAAELARAFPASNARVSATVVPLADEMVGDVRRALWILAASAACVLLIACANIANLTLARAARRRHEVGVRVALGASPGRIAAAAMVESAMLATAGAALGLVLASWSLALLQRMVPTALAGFVRLHLDGRVLAFTAAVAALATVLFGFAPALQMSRLPARVVRGSAIDRMRRVRSALVVAEIAIALVLAVGAGLLIQTLARLRAVDPGFRSDGILTASVTIPLPKYPGAAQRHVFYSELLRGVAAIPGVTDAGVTSDLPYTSRGNTMSLRIEGRPAPDGVGQDALFRLISAGYLPTIGARLLDGRFIDVRDGAGAQPVVVVNETLARQYWPAERAVGHRIDTGTGGGEPRWMTIVGVVADIRERGLDFSMKPAVYVPFAQTEITFFLPSELAVRTVRAPTAIVREVQAAVWSIDPEQPVSDVRTMDDIVDGELAGRTEVLQLLGALAALALVLAGFGVYAVLSFVVSQQTRDIGVRMAIGASRRDIVRAVLGQTARLTAAGVVVGAAVGAAATRLLRSLLFEVTPLDPATFAAVSALLAAISLAAAYVPTRRAATIDPLIALKAE